MTLDPLRLLDEIRTVQGHLAGLAAGRRLEPVTPRDPDLDRFMKSLATAWHDGEVRPTHQQAPKPPRHWRTRKDAFESAWPLLLAWLESDPDRTAKDLLDQLAHEQPGVFVEGQLRTLQRRVKDWRRSRARSPIFATADFQHRIAPRESAISA